ncbi:hypothetical protein [Chitinimonas koreensis]|uniref:hypothetical protein n=1 Tax=Chitinimonas koreensis TaxID=356302 RepID=UPI00040B3F07|nr:hypothetical protein [Chitinimonas koreensis]QNM99067.1 hypothetical protein H9L41_18500 [Chitinimonas koreensis]
MLIAAIAYLYVIGIVAVVSIAGGHVASGIFTLLFAGVLPTWLALTIVRRKQLNRLAQFRERQAAEAAQAETGADPQD